jgi:hypothetical protein
MNTNLYSQVHFFDTLRDTIVSQPYAILCFEELNSLINQIEKLVKYLNASCQELEYACDLRQAVENARNDGYFPIVVLPARKYEAALAFLRDNPQNYL